MDISTLCLIFFFFFLLLTLKLIRSITPSSHTKPPSSLRLPPGPWQLPLIGSLHHLLLSRHHAHPHQALRELSKTHGPLMLLRFGSVTTLVASTADAAREVMKTHDADFCSRHLSVTLGIISRGGRGVLFSPYGDRWRDLRKVCVLELFNPRRVRAFRHVREEEAARLLRSVSGDCAAGKTVDLGEAICRMVNDVVVRTTIGGRCRHRDEFLRELDEAVRLTGGFNLADLYPSSRLVRRLSKAARDMERCQKNVYRIIGSIIDERAVMRMPEREEEDDLLGVLLRLQREGGLQFELTNEIISTVIFDIFAAGSETSSTVLVWAMSELVKNPRVLHKAQSEVRETFKGKEKLTEDVTFKKKLTEDDMAKLSYLHLVIKEALRLHAPVPFLLPRECRQTCQVMGYDVPKGTKVLVNVWAIARDNKFWDDGEVFRPERFDGNSVDFRGNDFEFTPFGAGRRICPGITHGLANMELVLASLLYLFDWELPGDDDLDMTEAFGITLRRKSKLMLKAKTCINFV